MDEGEKKKTSGFMNEQNRRYIIYLVLFMGMIAIMDQYLSFIETTAIPNVLRDYSVTDAQYSWWKVLYFIPTFLIFLLNGLTDIIGRKKISAYPDFTVWLFVSCNRLCHPNVPPVYGFLCTHHVCHGVEHVDDSY